MNVSTATRRHCVGGGLYLRVDFDEGGGKSVPAEHSGRGSGTRHERRASLEYAILSPLRSVSNELMNLRKKCYLGNPTTQVSLTVAGNFRPFRIPVDPQKRLPCITSRFPVIQFQRAWLHRV